MHLKMEESADFFKGQKVNALEKAKLLKELLSSKAQLASVAGLTKAKLVAAILKLRDRLGMTMEKLGLAGRIGKNPVDLEQTLTAKQYSSQIHSWLPDLDVGIDSMERENAKGTAVAVERIASDYPELFHKKSVMRIFGSGKDLKKIRAKQQKRLIDEIDRIVRDKGLLEIKESEFDEQFSRFVNYFHGVETIDRYAVKLFSKKLLVDKEKELKELLKEDKISTKQFIQACKTAKVRNMARGEAADELRETKPELFETNIPNFRGMQQRSGTYAMYASGYGVIATTMLETNITAKYSKDVSANWHPAGTGGEAKHLAAQAIMTHELGHAMDRLLELSANKSIWDIWSQQGKQGISDGLSRYAAENVAEMIAEAFCEYKMSAKPRVLAQRIGTIIDQEYERVYGARK